jgi:phage portal protein BeeE
LAFRDWFRRQATGDVTEAAPERAIPASAVKRSGFESGIPQGGLDEYQAGVGASTNTDRRSTLTELYEAYIACPWAWACVNAIARTITAGGLVMDWDTDSGEGNQEQPQKPPEVIALERLIAYTNPRQNIRQLLRSFIIDLLVFGDAFLEVVWWGSQPVALYNLDSATTTPRADEHGVVAGYVQVTDFGQRAVFDERDVIHVSLDAPRSGIFGISPMQAALLPITAWLHAAATGKEMMRKGLPPELHADFPAGTSDNETRRWRDRYMITNIGPKNIGAPRITKGGAKFAELQAGKTSDVLAFKDKARDEILAAFGVPPAKATVIESGNLGGGTGESQNRTFEIDTCAPVAELVLEALNFAITKNGFGIDGWHAKFRDVDYRASQAIEEIRDMRLRNGSYCVDVETEILTQAGWKTHETLRAGDIVLTLNHETGNSEWQECQEVCLFPGAPREMVRMRSRAHSSLTTVDHRWPVENYTAGNKVKEWRRRWVTSETMTIWDRVLTAAPNATLPVEAKYDDAFVELVAWFWTEGHAPPRNKFVIITQKKPEGVERIRRALEKCFGPPYKRSKYHRKSDPGAWTEKTPRADGVRNFRIAASRGDLFREVVDDHVVSNEFLLALTQEQLDLFIEVSLLADGCNAVSGQEVLSQKREKASEQFQLACILAGRAATIREFRKSDRPEYRMWAVNVSKRSGVRPIQAAKQGAPDAAVERIVHDGIVWCPRTPNQSWMARRDGTVYFTGNTLNKYRAEIGEPPVEGGDDAVLVDRQNIVLWADMTAMSKAMVAGRGAPAVTAGEQPPGGEPLAGGDAQAKPGDDGEQDSKDAQAPSEAIPVAVMARYRARLTEALKAMPVTESGGDAGKGVYAQLAGNFPPSAIAWVKDAAWSGPKMVPLSQIDTSDRDHWDASREPGIVARKRRTLRKKLAAGKRPKPVVLVKRPSGKFLIADGHHRFLADEAEGQTSLWAYVGKVDAERGAWDQMAMSEKRDRAA